MKLRVRDSSATFAICIFLIAITWLVFGRTLFYPFVNYDDPGYVTQNPDVAAGISAHGMAWAFTHVHGGNWHPLTSLSHMLDCRFFGLNAGGHHFTNVLLHSVAAVLLFLVLNGMTGSAWPSAFVAAIFAIHPLRVESVAWIAERKDVLSGVFFALTLGAYMNYTRKPSLARYLTMSILFALGLLSKPMLVTTPLILLLLDYWPLQRMADVRTFWKRVMEKAPLFVLSAGSCVATLVAQKRALGSFENLPLAWRITNAIDCVFIYIRQMFWPSDLAVFYPQMGANLPLWQAVVGGALLVLITAIAFLVRKRFPYFLTGWLWYILMLVPVSGIVYVGLQGHADRYTYLPQIGLLILLSWTVNDLLASSKFRREIAATLAVLIVGALVWTARAQTSYWRDSEALWTRALAVTEDNDVAHINLSEVLLNRGQPAEAIPHAEEAIRLHPDNAEAYNNLGLAFIQTSRLGPGLVYLKRSLELNSNGVNAAATLAWVLATCPDPSVRDGGKAVQFAQLAIEQGGNSNPTLLHTLAAAYAEAGRYEEAINTAQEAMQLAKAQHNALLVKELLVNLGNYRQNLPLRDKGLTNIPVPVAQ